MQAVLFIPELWTWRHQPTREVLLREIAGVPLLTRVLATATRAGVDSIVVIWPQQLDRRILLDCLSFPVIKGLSSIEVTPLVSFDPADKNRSGSFLMFLVRESDGRYAPAAGQTDPGINVITKLPFAEQPPLRIDRGQ